jgi:hypothetical protein
MQEKQGGLRPPTVVATTLPFFARAATIVDETWHELDRMASALDQRAGQLSADSTERALLELMTSGMRELARRLEQTEVALSAYLPTP